MISITSRLKGERSLGNLTIKLKKIKNVKNVELHMATCLLPYLPLLKNISIRPKESKATSCTGKIERNIFCKSNISKVAIMISLVRD